MYKQKTMNWVKPSTVKCYGLVAVLAVLMTSCHQSQEKSNVTTTPTYQDQAEEFKKGLGGENMIMAEIIDSTLQRIYYYDTLKGIINYYDIVARKITPVWNCERVKSAKQYGRRLFYAYNWKDDDYEQVGTTICYIDLTNDSVHYFLSNTQNIDDDINESFIVSFLDDDIVIKTTYESTSWDTHISPYLSDEELNTASQNYTKKHNSVYEHHYEANKPVRNDGGGGGMDWLKGQWVNCFDIVEINMECMFMVVGKTSGEVVYQGRFAIENGQIVYDRQNGHYCTLDIDNTNKRIGDSRAGVWFSKRR